MTIKQQLPPHQALPPAIAVESRPLAATTLDDSSDDNDGPTDYELFLSSLKPLRKKPRLEKKKREKDSPLVDVLKSGDSDLFGSNSVVEKEDRERRDVLEHEGKEGEGEEE